MKVQRTIPPAATPLQFADLVSGLQGVWDGPSMVKRLESSLRDHFGVKYVFLLSSGKAALTLVLLALKSISRGREVILPAYTCFSVPSAVMKAGLDVAVCDIDPATLDFDFQALKKLVGCNTLCILPTHLFGVPSNVTAVREAAQESGAIIVEDAAQAMGGVENGKLLGTLGDVGIFSLGRGKSISCGSGGIIVTNSQRIGSAIEREYCQLRPVGSVKALTNLLEVLTTYCFIHPFLYWLPAGLPFLKLGETRFDRSFGLYRMDGIRAGLLRHWHRRLVDGNRKRTEASKAMRALAQGLEFNVPPFSCRHEHPYLRLPVLMTDREMKASLCSFGKARGSGISQSYPSAITGIPELREQLVGVSCPGADIVVDRLVTLPIHPRMCAKDYENTRNTLADWRRGVTASGDLN
jgi:perosamine synthetase